MPKIFCVGLPKTGLNSLYLALRKLGYTGVLKDPYAYLDLKEETVLKSIDKRDVVCGIYSYVDMDMLLDIYPDALLINTYRDRFQWIGAMERRYSEHFITEADSKRLNKCFGVEQYSFADMNQIWKKQSKWFQRYAIDNYGKTVQLDLFDGKDEDNWKALCDFLGKDIPEGRFPSHQSTSGSMAEAFAKKEAEEEAAAAAAAEESNE